MFPRTTQTPPAKAFFFFSSSFLGRLANFWQQTATSTPCCWGSTGDAGRLPGPGAGDLTGSLTCPSRVPPGPAAAVPPTCCAERETRHGGRSQPWRPGCGCCRDPVDLGSVPPRPGPRYRAHRGPAPPGSSRPAPAPQRAAPAASRHPPACLQRCPRLTPVPAVPRYRLGDSTAAPCWLTAGDCGAEPASERASEQAGGRG